MILLFSLNIPSSALEVLHMVHIIRLTSQPFSGSFFLDNEILLYFITILWFEMILAAEIVPNFPGLLMVWWQATDYLQLQHS